MTPTTCHKAEHGCPSGAQRYLILRLYTQIIPNLVDNIVLQFETAIQKKTLPATSPQQKGRAVWHSHVANPVAVPKG
jgi:hypothetical protein